MPDWEWSDDPNDPCAYCVYWGAPEVGEVNGWVEIDPEQAPPLNIDGEIVPRVYRGIHTACAESVAAYVAEHADD